jgi:hypothetical protein
MRGAGTMDTAWPIHTGNNGMTLHLSASPTAGTLPPAAAAS